MSEFKVGDKVRRVRGCDVSTAGIIPGGVYTVSGVQGVSKLQITLEESKYPSSLFYSENFELVETIKTDEELVAEYRAGVAAQREIRGELIRRGFTVSFRNPGAGLHTWAPLKALRTNPDEIRAVKFETYKVMEEVTKTRTIEL